MEHLDQSQIQQESAGPSTADTSRPNPIKRRSGRHRGTHVPGESRIGLAEPEYLNLGDAHEDIIEANAEIGTPGPESIQHLPPDVAPVSQLSERVYIQEIAGFRKAQRKQFEETVAERHRQAAAEAAGEANTSEFVHKTAAAIQTGIVSQTVFKTLAVTLQGLLAGFTIAHCLMVVFDTPPYFSNAHFINHYAPLALPAHCLYYVVLVICTLAALDRYDIGQSFLRVVYRAVTFQSGGLAVILYIAATVMNQIPVAVEERMTLYFRNMTNTVSLVSVADRNRIIITDQPWMEGELQLWRGCLIAKTILVTLAWILIAVRPGTDLLVKHLKQADAEFAQEFDTAKPESTGGHLPAETQATT